mgnify:FL=1
MPYFRKGDCITVGNERIVVEKFLSSGMQADVYRVVNFDRKKHMVIKHLYGDYCSNKKLFYRKVKLLSTHSAPHVRLIWPQAVSDFDEKTNSFVYLMDEISCEYNAIAMVMKNPDLLTMDQKMEICRQMAEVFSSLGNNGFIYSDVSGTNICYGIAPDGRVDVRVLDCDNISLTGESLGLAGSGLFRAPEVMLGASPTEMSDAYALAVAAFRMLTGCHPLDGVRTHAQPFTPEFVKESFGKNPEYIFAEATENVPLDEFYRQRFEKLPAQLQLYFNVMFSNKCLHEPEKRPTAQMLLTILQRFC